MPDSPPPSVSRKAGKTLLGWSEYVDFPDWGIKRMRAKIDTGARTSALHVENLDLIDPDTVRFQVILSRRHSHRRLWITTRVQKWARVRSSTGHYTTRCFVFARVRIGSVEKQIEVSLVSREEMVFRMLIGRKALEKDFLVDVSRRDALSGKKKIRKKKAKP